jgi:hypothetical protein
MITDQRNLKLKHANQLLADEKNNNIVKLIDTPTIFVDI